MKSVKYYSVHEVASELNIHPVTIYRDIKNHIITPERIGNNYLISSKDKDKLRRLHKKKGLI